MAAGSSSAPYSTGDVVSHLQNKVFIEYHTQDGPSYKQLLTHIPAVNTTYRHTRMTGTLHKCLTIQKSSPPYRFAVTVSLGGPFDRVGVDVIQFPLSYDGNRYAVVFVDYLTKSDQTSDTIARLLVEQLISRHGVPRELLSDRGAAFLSHMMQDVYEIMGIHKNTTAYHPQTDGLVERFNRTLTDMLAKKVEKNGRDWDKHLPYVLYAYRANRQESTQESPFYLLYGRDPQLPVPDSLTQPRTRY